MNVLLLCDRESDCYEGHDLRARITETVQSAGHTIKTCVLDGDALAPCRGCFGCWIKTPGLCVLSNDAVNEIAGEEIRADAVVLLSRIQYGGYSYDVKAFLDRSIPNISPFFEIYQGEMHHRMRYKRFPAWIAIGYGAHTEREGQCFVALAERNALNMRSKKHFAYTCESEEALEGAMLSLKKIFREELGI